ncbi:hypothetical protein MGU_08290 [Metarhizium guizhouense ARSEF 977]|uniref:Uncharacterized protein n=1 Tax=Metarhizium guizhouense (strain ARSEF 977) TaxID=1276136 RepID=A0A0B4GXN0_METGA|nr:hypothetical protein MGU_08290 [Metarhizium guizhouense ARSEF 977]
MATTTEAPPLDMEDEDSFALHARNDVPNQEETSAYERPNTFNGQGADAGR